MLSTHSKFYSRIRAAIVVIFVLPLSSIAAQDTKSTWSDGKIEFARIASSTNVSLDSLVRLTPKGGSSSEASDFLMHLGGIDTVFTIAASPEDFNLIPFGASPLYLVTDATTRSAIVFLGKNGSRIQEFNSRPGTEAELVRPVAGRAFIDKDGESKVIITDVGSDKIFIFDYTTKELDWFYPPSPNPTQLSGATAAVPVPGVNEILASDNDNNRILRIAYPAGTTLWSWGPGELNNPVDVEWGPDFALITDRDNHRVIKVSMLTSTITWQFGETATAGNSETQLRSPEDAQLLPNGNILISDTGNNRLIEVNSESEIVWQFLGTLQGIKSANRLESGKTLVVADGQTERIGYKSDTLEVQFHALAQPVDFDSLTWQADLPEGTDLQLQLRTAKSSGELNDAPWLGPGNGAETFSEFGAINALNDGASVYQYRLILNTNDPLLTPVINNVTLFYHFFDPNVKGRIESEVITDLSGRTINNWDELHFRIIQPEDATQRDDVTLTVNILDATTSEILVNFEASNTGEDNLRRLTDVDKLKTVQAIRLEALLETNNPSISPVLADWEVSWVSISSAASSLAFTDENRNPVFAVRTVAAEDARPGRAGILFINLFDANIVSLLDFVDVRLHALKSGDEEEISLERQASGNYILNPGMPVVIQESAPFVFKGNGLMEVNSRDSVIVRYTDPTDETDTATDTLLVLAYSSGIIQLENQKGALPADARLNFNDTLFVRVTGETDRNFSEAQDTIWASLFDNDTQDIREIMLVEVADSDDQTKFNTGDFFATSGTPLENRSVGDVNDGQLQTGHSNLIAARYIDNDTSTVVMRMEAGQGPGELFVPFGDGAFDFIFAPNPFRASTGFDFNLRMEAYSGDISLVRIEIFNLAGALVRSLAAGEVNMDRGTSISEEQRSTSRSPWWDLRTKDGAKAVSGTYWAKFHVLFKDGTGPQEPRVLVRKFVLIQ